ncbi:MAG: hypothetical protein HY594_00930, partial [Candidatus Omnitrophica bacterium]|nr:hypothetical protein [Candidatus Omnitrophota bacterium]
GLEELEKWVEPAGRLPSLSSEEQTLLADLLFEIREAPPPDNSDQYKSDPRYRIYTALVEELEESSNDGTMDSWRSDLLAGFLHLVSLFYADPNWASYPAVAVAVTDAFADRARDGKLLDARLLPVMFNILNSELKYENADEEFPGQISFANISLPIQQIGFWPGSRNWVPAILKRLKASSDPELKEALVLILGKGIVDTGTLEAAAAIAEHWPETIRLLQSAHKGGMTDATRALLALAGSIRFYGDLLMSQRNEAPGFWNSLPASLQGRIEAAATQELPSPITIWTGELPSDAEALLAELEWVSSGQDLQAITLIQQMIERGATRTIDFATPDAPSGDTVTEVTVYVAEEDIAQGAFTQDQIAEVAGRWQAGFSRAGVLFQVAQYVEGETVQPLSIGVRPEGSDPFPAVATLNFRTLEDLKRHTGPQIYALATKETNPALVGVTAIGVLQYTDEAGQSRTAVFV